MAPKEALKCSRQIIPIYESPIICIYIIPTLKSYISSKVLQLRDMPQGIKSNKQNKGGKKKKMYTHIHQHEAQPWGLSHAGGGRDNPPALLTSSRVCACAQRWIQAHAHLHEWLCRTWSTCLALQGLRFVSPGLSSQIQYWLILHAQEVPWWSKQCCSCFEVYVGHGTGGLCTLFLLKMTGQLLIFPCDGCGILLSRCCPWDKRYEC